MCNNDGMCLAELLEKILLIQRGNNNRNIGCNKPFLGDNTTQFNTRPIQLYCCCTNKIWEMPYQNGDVTTTANTYRIESVNENTATLRILIPSETGYTSTNNFFTIDLNYISCIKCLEDTLINL